MLQQLTLNPPMQRQSGDTIKRNGGRLEQWRGTRLVASWSLASAQTIEQAYAVGTTITNLILEVGMPGQNVSMTSVSENQTTGAITVGFSSGSNFEFPSWADLGQTADNLDSTPDFAEKILLGKAYRASPDGVNKTTQIGASVSVNLLANEPIVYTGADE